MDIQKFPEPFDYVVGDSKGLAILKAHEQDIRMRAHHELSGWVNNGGQEEDWLDEEESEYISQIGHEMAASIDRALARKPKPDPFEKYVVNK